MDEIELMSQEEVDAALQLWAIRQAARMRREKRCKWMRTYGLAILAGVLVGEVLWLASQAGVL